MPKIKIGDRVKVIADLYYDDQPLPGKTGTVIGHGVRWVLVKFDNWRSAWFAPDDLEMLT